MIAEKSKYFLQELKKIQKKHPEIGDVDGLGLAIRLEICEKDGTTPNRDFANKIFLAGMEGDFEHEGKRMGLVLNIVGYHKHVIALAPSVHRNSAIAAT